MTGKNKDLIKAIHISEKQQGLRQKLKENSFLFKNEKGSFVPTYGPFAWASDSERCTIRVSDSVCLGES